MDVVYFSAVERFGTKLYFRLQEISEALLNLDNDNATQIMGRPDDMKLKSSMTLFACADPENAVFEKVLEKFYNGHKDGRTLKMLSKENG